MEITNTNPFTSKDLMGKIVSLFDNASRGQLAQTSKFMAAVVALHYARHGLFLYGTTTTTKLSTRKSMPML